MNRVTRILGAALAAALSASPIHAEDAPLELIQAGDTEKSCAALATEINTLSERGAKAAKRAESSRKFLGFAGAALQAAAPLLSGGKMGGGQGSYMAQQALGSIQQQAMMQQQMQMQMQAMQQQAMQQQLAQAYGALPGMGGPPPAAEKPASIASQRVEHLRGIYSQKAC